MIEPNTPLTVTLAARQWDGVMKAMNDGLQAMAALIGEIQRQCMAADRPPFPMHAPPNGEAHEEASP